MTFAAIVSDDFRNNLTDVAIIGGAVSVILVPVVRWLRNAIGKTVHDAIAPVVEAVKGHQRTLEAISRNELSQLLPNGGSSMRDALEEIRTTIKEKLP